MKRPASIKWVHGIASLSMVFSSLMIGAFIVFVEYKPPDGFWKGFRDALASRFDNYDWEAAGAASAGPLLSMILFALLLASIEVKKRPIWIPYLIAALIALLYNTHFLIPLLVIILLCRKSARNYMRGNMENDRSAG